MKICIAYYFYTATMVNTGLQPHTQNMYYLLLLQGNNGYANAPLCYVYTYTACLVYFYFSVVFLLFRVRVGGTERCVVSYWVMYVGKYEGG
jgi:hypothetical protein